MAKDEIPYLIVFGAIVAMASAVFVINLLFLNGIILFICTLIVSLVLKPSMKLSLLLSVVAAVIICFVFETILHNCSVARVYINQPFEQFSSLKLLFHNYEDFQVAVTNAKNFHVKNLYNLNVWFYSVPIFVPLGMLAANIYIFFNPRDLKDAYQKGTKKKLKLQKYKNSISKSAIRKMNRSPASVKGGSVLGVSDDNKTVVLKDTDANKNTAVIGPTGSGKTNTICNCSESFIDRNHTVIFIDGKGDAELAKQMLAYATSLGTQTYYFSADNKESDNYDPFYVGGYTSKKDRVMTTLDWSEQYYENAANVYLQTVMKILTLCQEQITFQSIIHYADAGRLAQLLRENEKHIDDFDAITSELQSLNIDKKDLQGLIMGLQTFANSEIGEKLQTSPNKKTIRFKTIIEENALVYISLCPMEFPKHSRALGRLIINDLKATLSEYMKGDPCKVLIVFDEFSSFSGEEILNLVNQGRATGAHIITGTQSIADFERAVPSNGAAFKEQMLANHKNFIIHAQNTTDSAEFFSKSIGTRKDYEPTVQIDKDGVTGMGSIREVQEFVEHPNNFKNLKMGEAYFIQNVCDSKPQFTKVRLSKIISRSQTEGAKIQ